MSCSEACLVGKSQGDLVGQPEMQGLIRIQEYSGGSPEARQKSEQGKDNRGRASVVLEPLILTF